MITQVIQRFHDGQLARYSHVMHAHHRQVYPEGACRVSYLRVENQIMRSRLPDRISLTQREKNRLVRFIKNLGSALIVGLVIPQILKPQKRVPSSSPRENT